MATSQWQRIQKRNNERLRVIAQESYVEVASSVITKSPVDTGLFRNNWFSGLNEPSTQTTTAKSRKPFGEPGGARFTEFLHLSTDFNLGDELFLTNSLPYARRLEFGWSPMARSPDGMVRRSAAQWPFIVSKLAKKIQ